MKTCSKCHQEKDFSAFYADKSKTPPYSSQCKDCQRQGSLKRYHAEPERHKTMMKRWYGKNRDKVLSYGRDLRLRVLAEYGNACKCCGETTPEFLGIDHVNNDGESHRRELAGYGRSIYRWLEQNGYPKDGFQLLCHNCNMAKGLYGGCPHQGTPPGRRMKTTRWNKVGTPAIGESL